MDEHLKSSQKDPTIDELFSFLPKNLISKFNADKANDNFVGLFNKIQQKNIFKTESQQQIFSHICNYSSHMHWEDDKDLLLSGFLNVDATKSSAQIVQFNL